MALSVFLELDSNVIPSDVRAHQKGANETTSRRANIMIIIRA